MQGRRGRRAPLVAALVTALVCAVALVATVRGHDGRDGREDGRGAAADDPPADCTVDALLVDPCRPWYGGTANRYPDVPNDKLEQMKAMEQRVGRPMEVAHTYHPVGDDSLNDADLFYATRDDTYLFVNWRLTYDWASADGSNDAMNAAIDEMAGSIKALGDKKMFLALFGEPEKAVTADPSCADGVAIGSSGTPEQYRAMWSNVRARFDALGVDNVVWAMNYMSYDRFDCMIDDLYPGDDLVDWVVFNGYQHGNQDVDFDSRVAPFYDLLTSHSGPGHDYLAKPWGLSEWGINGSTQANAYRYYAQARTAVETETFPKLKLFMIFDNGNAETGDFSHRVSYATDGSFDPVELRAFNAFANTTALGGPGPAADTVPPGTTQDLSAAVQADGKVRLTWGVASDDVAVVSYEVLRDGVPLGTTDATVNGGSFTDVSPGRGVTRTYTVRATDSSGNVGDTAAPVVVPIPVADISAPTRPTNLAVAIVSGQPRLSWNAASDDVGVVAYDVLRNGAAVASTSALSFVDTAAAQGRTHTWAVRARDAAGNVGPLSAQVRRALPDTTPPSAPQGFSVVRSGTRATLRWQAATDNVAVTGYWVYRGTSRVAQLGSSARSYVASSLRTGTTYTFRVVARDAAGNLGSAASATG